jgi:hypothetical protein
VGSSGDDVLEISIDTADYPSGDRVDAWQQILTGCQLFEGSWMTTIYLTGGAWLDGVPDC